MDGAQQHQNRRSKMGFWRRAFLNTLKGGGITVGLVVAGMIGMFMFTAGSGNLPKLGWRERLDVILVASATWGALTGFCSTRPECSHRTMVSGLLVLLAVVLSVLIPFAIDLAIDGRVKNFADTLVFALLGPALGAGIVCGIKQFSKQKAAEKME